jgi:hypothetical protein
VGGGVPCRQHGQQASCGHAVCHHIQHCTWLRRGGGRGGGGAAARMVSDGRCIPAMKQ